MAVKTPLVVAAAPLLAEQLQAGDTLSYGTLIVVGTGDGTGTLAAGTVRGPNAAGTNVAGANLVLAAGDGTGTGGSGHILLQTAPAGASGTTADTLATALDVGPAMITASLPLLTLASAAGAAGLNVAPGTAPTTPSNGDLWVTAAGLYVQVNGSTIGPFGPTTVLGTGDGTATLGGGTLRGPAAAGTNIAGADTHIDASNGTGTGGSGHILARTAAPGASGTTANTLTTCLDADPNGNVALTPGAPGTTATDGFVYVPVTSGTPTGVPTSKTGFVPIVFDSSANKFWAYIGGAWKGVVLT